MKRTRPLLLPAMLIAAVCISCSSDKKLDDKTFVVFGDSITEFTDSLGKSYTDYLAEYTGAEFINVGVGGIQFRERTAAVEDPDTFLEGYAGLDMISLVRACASGDFTIPENSAVFVRDTEKDDNTAIIARMKAIRWNEVDGIIFFAGTNDWNVGQVLGTPDSGTVDNTLGAVTEIIRIVKEKWPDKEVIWFTPTIRWKTDGEGRRTDATYSDNALNREGLKLQDYIDAITATVTSYGIPCHDLYHNLGWNQENFSNWFSEKDGTHPRKGFPSLARHMADVLMGNITSKKQ